MQPKLQWFLAIGFGWAAFACQMLYLNGVYPLQADFGIQISGALLIAWTLLILKVVITDGWRSWRVLAISSPALIGPALFLWLVVGCFFDSGNCL
ncbi:MAG: hypothetical protein AAFP91_12455 [Pseudomonadota bacterium]